MTGRRGFRATALCFGLTAMFAISSAMGSPAAIAASRANGDGGGALTWLRLAAGFAAPLQPIIDALDGSPAINTGSDGRLTFLLLGSDARGAAVSRTDTMLIMSVKGTTINAASLPRDTGRVPKPEGGTFSGKANGILRQRINEANGNVEQGLDKFEKDLEWLFGIEIDYHALIWFSGFTTLVDKIDPVMVNSGREILDKKHIDDPDGPHGVYFPKWNGYALYAWNPSSYSGAPYCNGAWQNDTNPPIDSGYWCHRALPFVRSRKGPYNDDWVRARRQQDFIGAAIKAVSSTELSSLESTAEGEGMGKWLTNYPITPSSAVDLYNALHNATLVNQVVFKPSTYAARIAGTSAYQLHLDACRAWAAQYLK
jgi:hypothetical protein